MNTFTNRCSSASNSLIKFRRSPYFSFLYSYVYKSPDPDGIHPRISDETRNIIAAPLKKYLKPHYYVKNYLTIGELQIFQPFIKMAINQNLQVSFTYIICKLMEKEVKDYLLDHFLGNNLFSNCQYGFLKGQSTVLQLLHIMDEWT